uniref:Uncharacterized protein n=1 Tax=Oryza glumipatula TaxID=40148 RepID=A0A0E0B1E1_9ORYZ
MPWLKEEVRASRQKCGVGSPSRHNRDALRLGKQRRFAARGCMPIPDHLHPTPISLLIIQAAHQPLLEIRTRLQWLAPPIRTK